MRAPLPLLPLVSIVLLGLAAAVAPSRAQDTPIESLALDPWTYPISPLGGCRDRAECRAYCDDPVNREACRSFGTEYRRPRALPIPDLFPSLLERAKEELGCSSAVTCQGVCALPERYDACDAFAKRQGIEGGYRKDPEAFLASFVAKSASVRNGVSLCTTVDSCQTACEDRANWDVCSAAARKLGIRGGFTTSGPGGCTTPRSCRRYCDDPANAPECVIHGWSGPKGCRTEKECWEVCEREPSRCTTVRTPARADINDDGLVDEEDVAELARQCRELADVSADGSVDPADLKRYCDIVRESFLRHCPQRASGTTPPETAACRVAPVWMVDYQDHCRARPAACRESGYHDYCTENPRRCAPLMNGIPLQNGLLYNGFPLQNGLPLNGLLENGLPLNGTLFNGLPLNGTLQNAYPHLLLHLSPRVPPNALTNAPLNLPTNAPFNNAPINAPWNAPVNAPTNALPNAPGNATGNAVGDATPTASWSAPSGEGAQRNIQPPPQPPPPPAPARASQSPSGPSSPF